MALLDHFEDDRIIKKNLQSFKDIWNMIHGEKELGTLENHKYDYKCFPLSFMKEACFKINWIDPNI